MIVTRIKPRWRVDVPLEVQQALDVKPGDLLRYEIDGDRVIISKGNPVDAQEDTMTDEALRPIIDAALRETGPTYSGEEVFAELHARIDARGQVDAA